MSSLFLTILNMSITGAVLLLVEKYQKYCDEYRDSTCYAYDYFLDGEDSFDECKDYITIYYREQPGNIMGLSVIHCVYNYDTKKLSQDVLYTYSDELNNE